MHERFLLLTICYNIASCQKPAFFILNIIHLRICRF